jgi:GT2 family glycosyltransferase
MKGISVIIPTLNRTEFVLNTLKDLVKQECDFPFEIVIIDQSDQVDIDVLNFCKNSPLCVYHHITFFKGLPEARNFGWQKAIYNYILYIDDDINCKEDLLHEHFSILKDDAIGVVAGGIVEVYKNNQECKVGDFNYWTATPLRGFHKKGTFEVIHGGGGNFSTKKEVLLKINGIDENFTKGAALYEETDFCLRVRQSGYKIMFHSNASVNHLAAETGGCRVPNIKKYIASLVRNRSLIISRHVKGIYKITATLYLLKLVSAYVFSYKEISFFKQFISSFKEGMAVGKNKVICTKYTDT